MKKHLLPSNKTENYEFAVEFANQQLEILWLPDEINVEKDIQDMRSHLTESEYHGVVTVLKLFTLYELYAGDEYWGGRFKRIFPNDPAMHRMASVFAAFELGVHAPFYQKINEVLHLDDDEFYMSYIDNPTLKARMEHIDAIISSDNDLLSLAGFSIVEGGVLYSNFGFLKHFQSQGKNHILNINRGVAFSLKDENLHHLAGALSFKSLKAKSNLSEKEEFELEALIIKTIHVVREHEHTICDMIFEKGPIDGITSLQLKHFVDSRLNLCLEHLGYNKEFDVTYNPVGEWFYQGINNFQFNDFFSGMGSNYNRNWDEDAFVYETYKGTRA